VKLRAVRAEDAARIALVYAPFVTDNAVSFETSPPDAGEIASRIEAGGDLYPWIVAEDADGGLAGYAYATAFRARPAYRHTVETTVYLAPSAQRKGLGRRLYASLLATLEAQGFTQAIAAVTLPNPASVRLHESLGFIAAGVYRDVGYKLGGWHSVGLWQRPLAPLSIPPAELLTVAKVGLQIAPGAL
jgi:L-amino acid N-acyltransferase YncA